MVNVTKGWGCGGSGVYETFTDSLGELYRSMRKEYGRCVGRVYVDGPDGESKPIGWIFQKRAKYEDNADTYLQEVWVTVHTAPPTKTVVHHYKELD